MCVCVFICVNVCICLCMFTCVCYTCTFIYVYMCVYVYHLYMCVCYSCIYVFPWVYVCVFILCTCVGMCVCVYVCTFNMFVCTCVYVCVLFFSPLSLKRSRSNDKPKVNEDLQYPDYVLEILFRNKKTPELLGEMTYSWLKARNIGWATDLLTYQRVRTIPKILGSHQKESGANLKETGQCELQQK